MVLADWNASIDIFNWTMGLSKWLSRLGPPLSDVGYAGDLISETTGDEAYQREETCDPDPSCSKRIESIKSHLSMWTAHVLPALTGHTQRALNYDPILLNSRIISYYRDRMRVLFVWSSLPIRRHGCLFLTKDGKVYVTAVPTLLLEGNPFTTKWKSQAASTLDYSEFRGRTEILRKNKAKKSQEIWMKSELRVILETFLWSWSRPWWKTTQHFSFLCSWITIPN